MKIQIEIFGGQHSVAVTPEVAVKRKTVTPVERNPLIRFSYPSSHCSWIKLERHVRLIGANSKYYIGLEILSDNKFKFKKFLKSKASNFEVLEFNPSSVS